MQGMHKRLEDCRRTERIVLETAPASPQSGHAAEHYYRLRDHRKRVQAELARQESSLQAHERHRGGCRPMMFVIAGVSVGVWDGRHGKGRRGRRVWYWREWKHGTRRQGPFRSRELALRDAHRAMPRPCVVA